MWPIWPNGLDWQCCLAGSSKTAPRILIFSIAIGVDYTFYVETIETHAHTFLTPNILAIGRVNYCLRIFDQCGHVVLMYSKLLQQPNPLIGYGFADHY